MQSVVAMWKKRGSTPKAQTIQKLANYFGVSTDDLIDDETTVVIPAGENFTENMEGTAKASRNGRIAPDDDFVKAINDISDGLTAEDKRMLLDMARHLRNTHQASGAVITSKGPYYLYNYADSPSEAADHTPESRPAPQESEETSPKDEK